MCLEIILIGTTVFDKHQFVAIEMSGSAGGLDNICYQSMVPTKT